jgi:transposase-like protein
MNKRRRRSDAEWRHLIEQHKRSGLSAFAFCQQHGLSSKTFYKRRQALQQQAAADPSAKRFIKVQPKSTLATATQATAVLHYHYTRLQLPAGVDALWLAKLMQALS